MALENCLITGLSVTGTIRVANVSYHKSVAVRYTVNRWSTRTDIPAAYVHNSSDGSTDRFSFSVSLPSDFAEGSQLEFAIVYRCDGQEFWDSNFGKNYIVECYAKAIPISDCDNTWLHFS